MASPEAARQALAQMGATLARARHFEDNELFDDERHSLRARGRVLRLRHNDQGAQLTAKGPRRDVDGVKSRPEVEMGVGDGGQQCLQVTEQLRPDAFEPATEVRVGSCGRIERQMVPNQCNHPVSVFVREAQGLQQTVRQFRRMGGLRNHASAGHGTVVSNVV